VALVRGDGPPSHTTGAKPRTPTMGGLAFIPAGVLAALAFTRGAGGDPTVLAVAAATLVGRCSLTLLKLVLKAQRLWFQLLKL